MARTVTGTAIKRIMTKGLSGWEAGRLILQDSIDLSCGMPSVLTAGDMAAITNAPMQGKDVRDYNKIMTLGQAFEKGLMVCETAWRDACLDLSFLITLLRDANKRSTVEVFTSLGPHVVTRREYDEIVTAQRQKKLEFEYSLGYVVEERFYALAPKARQEIENLCLDIQSTEEFVGAVPEEYTDLCEKAIEQIRALHSSGKLKATYDKKNAKVIRPLLTKWKKRGLAFKETSKLLDMLYVTGQQLCKCRALPEWKTYMDTYQQYVHGDEDERFRHVYAIVEDCPGPWLDESGCYRDPSPPSGWITRGTEHALDLRALDNGEHIRTVEEVGAMLRFVLSRVESNIRLFLALKAILETALEVAELDSHGDAALTAQGAERLRPYVEEYHHRLARVKKEPGPRKGEETKLEQALKVLPAVDLEQLTPTPESRKALESNVLSDMRDDAWFKMKLRSLEYTDGFSFDA